MSVWGIADKKMANFIDVGIIKSKFIKYDKGLIYVYTFFFSV